MKGDLETGKIRDLADEIFYSICSRMNLLENSKGFFLLKKAYEISKFFHQGQLRKDGKTPYIVHPMSVGLLLAEVNSDLETVIAGILHDTIEDTKYTLENLQKDFGKVVARLVNGVTFLRQSIKDSGISKDEASVFKLFSSIPNDYRIILIKTADVLHNAKNIQFLSPERQVQTIEKIKKYYLKLAEYLGVSKFWTEIYEIIFKFEHPKEYEIFSSYRDFVFEKLRKFSFDRLQEEIESKFKTKIDIFKLKREFRRASFSDSVVSLAIVFDSKERLAYEILNFLKSKFLDRGIEKDVDYIKNTKENGWISLNSTLIVPKVGEVRFLIIPKSHYLVNMFGINAISNSKNFPWKLQSIRDFIKKGFELQNLTQEFLVNQIKVFCTNTGMSYLFPKNSSILDLVAENYPNQFINFDFAFINRKKCDWSYELKENDLIDFLSFSDKNKVSFFWIQKIKTEGAKRILQNHYGEANFELMQKGYEFLKNSLQLLNVNLDQMSDDDLKIILSESGFENFDDLIKNIGKDFKQISKIFLEKVLTLQLNIKKQDNEKFLNSAVKNNINFLDVIASENGDVSIVLKILNFYDLINFINIINN